MLFVGKVWPADVKGDIIMTRIRNIVIEKQVGDDWQETKIKHLVFGDIFRMWMYVDDDWKLYEKNGHKEFEAKSNPYLHPELGIWSVSVEEGIFSEEKDR